MEYRLTGAQDPSARIDRVLVESASEDHPQGKVLELNGRAVELSDEQVGTLSGFVRLEAVKEGESVAAQVVDQPDVDLASRSTDNPPDLGTAPDVSKLDKDGLVALLDRVRAQDPQALEGLSERSNKEDLKQGLSAHYGQEA